MWRKLVPVILFLSTAYGFAPATAPAWGFFGHKKINELAVFTLPPEMIGFYKRNIEFIVKHSVDADRRRYSDSTEAVKHYIDIDHYEPNPFDSLPRYWQDAVKKYSEDTLREYGVVPWHISLMLYRLTEAFRQEDVNKVLYTSANLGHYIADAHVPLHTTENYNGQLTNQKGIHSFWESRLPELFSGKWDFFVGRAEYLNKTNDRIWQIIRESYAARDSVLKMEAELNANWPQDKKYVTNKGKKIYSEEYSAAYNQMLNGMVERRMRASVLTVGSFWYTAWVNAGQPDLDKLMQKQVADSIKAVQQDTVGWLKSGRPPKGHDE